MNQPADSTATDEQSSVIRWHPLLGVLLVILLYYAAQFAAGLIVSVFAYAHHWTNHQAVDWLNNSVSAQFAYILLAEAFTLGGLYLFLRAYQSNFFTIGLRRPKGSDFLYGLLATPVYYVLYLITIGVVTHFVKGFDVNQQQNIGFNDVHGVLALTLTFVSLVILPPITEEILVRGFLYSSLKKALPLIWAALLTSAMFAIAHLPEGGASGPLYIAALDTFVLSLVLIYLREKTGGLWASITLHAIKNGVAFAALFILHLS
jgi:membrane protease YdiL (CAAX protease family)